MLGSLRLTELVLIAGGNVSLGRAAALGDLGDLGDLGLLHFSCVVSSSSMIMGEYAAGNRECDI